jgi:hypothetical protein
MFLDHGFEQTNYQADYSAVDAERWAVASAQSIHPGLNRPTEGPLDYTVLRELVKEVIVDRPQTADENAAESAQNTALNTSWAAAHPPAPTHRAPMPPCLRASSRIESPSILASRRIGANSSNLTDLIPGPPRHQQHRRDHAQVGANNTDTATPASQQLGPLNSDKWGRSTLTQPDTIGRGARPPGSGTGRGHSQPSTEIG